MLFADLPAVEFTRNRRNSAGIRYQCRRRTVINSSDSESQHLRPSSEPFNVSTDTSFKPNEACIVFFDGVCGLCNHTINFLMARDKKCRLRFAPLQGQTAEQLVPKDVRSRLNTFVFSENGRLFYRSTALVRILMQIRGIWRIMGALLWLVPWPLRDIGYRIVAGLRYRLFGKHETCRLPTPAERALFLD